MDGSKKDDATPADVPAFVLEWFSSKSVDELEARTWEGRPLYPGRLVRKVATSKGTTEEPVMLRTPTIPERAKAQIDACKWAARVIGIPQTPPPTIDVCKAHLGPVEFANMSIATLAAVCIREVAPPHNQFAMAEILTDTFGPSSLAMVSDRIDGLCDLEDPRLPDLDEKTFDRLIGRVAEVGHVGPLGVIAGRARSSCIVTMAVQLERYRASGSSPRPPETPTLKDPGSTSSNG